MAQANPVAALGNIYKTPELWEKIRFTFFVLVVFRIGTHVTVPGVDTNVLLAFFPLAFTSVCTAELCDMSLDLDKFAGRRTVVLPISVDSVPTLKEFRAKLGLGMDLLSDFKRDISRAYGVLMDDKFYSRRAYFLVDRAGRLAWVHVEAENKERRPDDELLARIAALA